MGDTEAATVKAQIRDYVTDELGDEVEFTFVEAGNRIDVRITDLGLVDELRARHEDLSVTTYGDYRFTIQLD
jgi:hypothetical protein